MRMAEIEFVKALSLAQVSNIIPIIEKGIELQKLETIATKDPEARGQVSDASILLSFLYFRTLQESA
jgi:hypothetical protein